MHKLNKKSISIAIEWRINQLHTRLLLTQSTWLDKKQSHSQFQAHQFAQQEQFHWKVQQIDKSPDEKFKESTNFQKPQMRKSNKVHIFKKPRWEFTFYLIILSQRDKPQHTEREREREIEFCETERVWERSLLEMIDWLNLRKREILYIYVKYNFV